MEELWKEGPSYISISSHLISGQASHDPVRGFVCSFRSSNPSDSADRRIVRRACDPCGGNDGGGEGERVGVSSAGRVGAMQHRPCGRVIPISPAKFFMQNQPTPPAGRKHWHPWRKSFCHHCHPFPSAELVVSLVSSRPQATVRSC